MLFKSGTLNETYGLSDEILNRLAQAEYTPEEDYMQKLLDNPPLTSEQQAAASKLAGQWIELIRKDLKNASGPEAMLMKYDLSSEEGICLLSLAEALLRIPDTQTINDLIGDKLTASDWKGVQESVSRFASIGLNVSGSLFHVVDPDTSGWQKLWSQVCRKLSGGTVRTVLNHMMKMLSEQFILGSNIAAAMKAGEKTKKANVGYSYDMLGEVARTEADAQRYYQRYVDAIDYLKDYCDPSRSVLENPGISVKLSSLHPRYEFNQWPNACPILIERLLTLAKMAAKCRINLTVDAEEVDRLELSLAVWHSVFVALHEDESCKSWDGFGLAIQGYQKRAREVIDICAQWGREYNTKIPVRLVKGAYWDTEIKHAQVMGFTDYNIFTQRQATDLNYLDCARDMIANSDALMCQFATHNAYSAAAISQLIFEQIKKTPDMIFEFQHLHGMGDELHDQILEIPQCKMSTRIYAPVGEYEDLLPYLVRRLLENGANNSFVQQITDENISVQDLSTDPSQADWSNLRHPKIPLPVDIYKLWKNSMGVDWANAIQRNKVADGIQAAAEKTWTAAPSQKSSVAVRDVVSPADHSKVVGTVVDADSETALKSLSVAEDAFKKWQLVSPEQRAEYLETLAEKIELAMNDFIYIVSQEAGRLLPDVVDEVREAADFCRYYARQARENLVTQKLPGPTGEDNFLHYLGRGVVLCISPWNFPLAIFVGQFAAAVAAGNVVLAKSAEQTPLTAQRVLQCVEEAGFPEGVVQHLPGEGSVVCKDLWQEPALQGVMFTGSTATAQIIQKQLAERASGVIPFIGETGGLNVMIVDSSALSEQVVADVLRSSFNSAGQRCSALRVLCVQEEAADRLLEMLIGAMKALVIDKPDWLTTDVGPVIDSEAFQRLQAYSKENQERVLSKIDLPDDLADGYYVSPTIFELNDLTKITEEVFGPFLQFHRYSLNEIDNMIDQINGWGYGLTFGVHSRIQSTINYLQRRVRVGNIYVNRNVVGAVVGVQPFGGCGLSGSGPKAGGPNIVMRLIQEQAVSVDTTAVGGNASLYVEVSD